MIGAAASGDYVASMPTLLGGRMLGHHVAFRPSAGAVRGYGGFYGAADTSKRWKVTDDGRVWGKYGLNTTNDVLAFDGATKLIYGDPDAWYAYVPTYRFLNTGTRPEIAAATIESYATYAEAEARARAIIAGGQAALQQAALAPIVAPQYNVQSGSELINTYAEKDAARLAAAVALPKKKPGKKPRKKPIPTWVWVTGGGAIVLLLVGGVALSRRRQITG